MSIAKRKRNALHTLVLLASLICSEVSISQVLEVLFAFILHAFGKAVSEKVQVRRLASLFLQFRLEISGVLFYGFQPVFQGLSLHQQFRLSLLGIF